MKKSSSPRSLFEFTLMAVPNLSLICFFETEEGRFINSMEIHQSMNINAESTPHFIKDGGHFVVAVYPTFKGEFSDVKWFICLHSGSHIQNIGSMMSVLNHGPFLAYGQGFVH